VTVFWLWWDAYNKANARDKIMSIEEMVYNIYSMKYVDTLHTGEIRGKV
jgi:hypothetical protein